MCIYGSSGKLPLLNYWMVPGRSHHFSWTSALAHVSEVCVWGALDGGFKGEA